MKTDSDILSKVRIPLPPLVRCTFVVAVAIFILVFTESYVPGGSGLALLVLGFLAFHHLKLLTTLPVDNPGCGEVKRPGFFLGIVVILILVTCAQFLYNGQKEVFEKGVSPYGNVHLGAITQVVSRFEQGDALYTAPIQRDGYQDRNGIPVGLAVPYAIARSWGWDWRYAPLVSIALLGGLLSVSGGLVLLRSGNGDVAFKTFFVIFLGGAAWLILPAVRPYLHWGQTIVLWPLIAGLGVCLCKRWALMAAVLAGWLAAMNPGWLILGPVVLAFLWKEDSKRFGGLVALWIVWPLISYGMGRESWMMMGEGILGNLFLEGNKLREAGLAWRYTSLHGIGDVIFLNLRYPLYLFALLALSILTYRIVKENSRVRRFQLLAFSSFLLLVCGPVCFTHHWMAHGIFLAVLIPGSWEWEKEKAPTILWIKPPVLGGGVAVLLLLFLAGAYMGIPASFGSSEVGYRQKADQHLLTGFWVGDSSHTWGRSRYLAVGFPLKAPQAAVMELDLGVLGGEFTPFNPVEVWVNGRPKGLFRILPGDYRFARVPLEKGDLHRGMNTVQFQTAWSRVPNSLHANNDLRTLSLCYKGFSIILSNN